MSSPLGMFEGFGIELEYMLVDAEDLRVRPIADLVLRELERLGSEAAAGEAPANCATATGATARPAPGESAEAPPMEVELGDVAWSNELALHVIELKTNGPVPELSSVPAHFERAVSQLQGVLDAFGARLMPTAMHPLMQPEKEFRLWPRDDEGIYATFNRIFDCRGHGWSNLQSMHVNLPFANDAQFATLHAAVRLLLPLLPALAASSPLIEGRFAPHLDERLHTYRGNAAKIPSIAGDVVPESVRTRAQYEREILGRAYLDLKPFDPEGVLQHEWVNARGAIARFDRMAIEIRVLDAQECPKADLALAHLVSEVLRAKVHDHHALLADDARWQTAHLSKIFDCTVQAAESALIEDREFLRSWGLDCRAPLSALQAWRELAARVPTERRDPELWPDVDYFLQHGSLASRIRSRLGARGWRDTTLHPNVAEIHQVYFELCECLATGQRFAA